MIYSIQSHISFIALLVLFSLGHGVIAQPTFYAHIDNEKVYKGSFFKVEYQLSNARGSRFKPPKFKAFKIAAGPARSYKTTVVNGKASSYESYSYTLQALNEGDYTIPPATIAVGGKTIQTNPLNIMVLPPLKEKDLLSKGAPTGEEYFLVAEFNHDTAFVGQQIILDYRIFTKKNIDKLDFKSLPDLTSFYWEGLQLVNESADQVEISGQQYTTKLLKRYALFPKQSGTYDLSPAQLLLMFPKPRKRGFFFDNYETRYVNSNSLTLVVNSLPETKPERFTGLVGSYTMEANSRREKLTTDDAITVHMRIKGNGDANRMSLKPILSSKGLEQYDPKIISKNSDKNQKKRDHFAVIEYLYTTSKPGNYIVQPAFTYFDVDSSAFVTLKSDSLMFRVGEGSGLVHAETIDTAIVYELVSARATKPNNFWAKYPWASWAWMALFLSAIVLSFSKWRQINKASQVQIKTKKEIVIEELKKLSTLEHGEIAHRIEELLGDYFRDKLNIEESKWSNLILVERLSQIDYPGEKTQALITLLDQCKFAAYAGIGQAQKQEWVDRAIGLVE